MGPCPYIRCPYFLPHICLPMSSSQHLRAGFSYSVPAGTDNREHSSYAGHSRTRKHSPYVDTIRVCLPLTSFPSRPKRRHSKSPAHSTHLVSRICLPPARMRFFTLTNSFSQSTQAARGGGIGKPSTPVLGYANPQNILRSPVGTCSRLEAKNQETL
jgi:hypothetical protein